jgi:hypothetical protein
VKVSLKLFNNKQEKLEGCGTAEWCAKCRLFNKVCAGNNGGCTTKQDVAQRECYSACNTCGGGPAKPHSAPAVCCKSPLKTILLEQALGAKNEEGKEFFLVTPRPKIVVKHTGIVVTQGSPGAAFGSSDSPFPPEVEAVAVNIRHVWSKSAGWWSDDLRDYLRVPANVKLILLTSVFDNRLEDAWDAGLHEEDFSQLGFDYWQNLSFSIYAEDSPMQSYWSTLRSLRSVQGNKSWFAEDVRAPRLMPEWTKARLLEQVSKLPQLVLNFQFIRGDKAELLAHGADLKAYHALLPANVAIWILGPVQPAAIRFFKKLAPNRSLYFLSALPWIGAHRGALLSSNGKLVRSKINKKDLVWANQRAYLKITSG